MTALLYYLVIYPISRLPYAVLYAISDVLRFVLYHIFGFRLSVIRTNLRNSFPEKSKEELRQIEQVFYTHMCDLIVESIKYFTITQKRAEENFSVKNAELLQELYEKGKSVIIVGGHYGSWEAYALNATRGVPHFTAALYTPLTNPFFDEKMRESRSRFGLNMVSIKDTRILFDRIKEEPIAVIFGSDQSPSNPHKAYWMRFLNQETAVQFGAEKFAKEFNCAVVYGQLAKEPRKSNGISYRLICEDPSALDDGVITETFTRMLEEKIRSRPAFWLWSHRRWKHARPADMPLSTR